MNAFNRIAGYKEEKEELIKLCNLIKNREELVKVGGKLPRGVFLLGPNGVGKTIMANSCYRMITRYFFSIILPRQTHRNAIII